MSKTICLDAGHYGKYNRSPAVPSYYESDMNWKLHNLLAKELESYGFTVVKTRTNKAKDLDLTARGKMAKGSDLFISIHSNASGSTVNESVDYVAVYHLTEDTATTVDEKSKAFAKKIAPVIAETMKVKQGFKILSRKSSNDRNGDGVLNDNYYGVLNGARKVNVPGVILEHSFHTNTKSAEWLSNNDNLEKMAKAEAEVIAKHFGVDKPVTYYRVQVGAYKILKNAKRTAEVLRDAGIKTYLVESGGMYKVQVGAYANRKNAELYALKLRKMGFATYITTKSGNPVKEG